jgi:hypothetical protein
MADSYGTLGTQTRHTARLFYIAAENHGHTGMLRRVLKHWSYPALNKGADGESAACRQTLKPKSSPLRLQTGKWALGHTSDDLLHYFHLLNTGYTAIQPLSVGFERGLYLAPQRLGHPDARRLDLISYSWSHIGVARKAETRDLYKSSIRDLLKVLSTSPILHTTLTNDQLYTHHNNEGHLSYRCCPISRLICRRRQLRQLL